MEKQTEFVNKHPIAISIAIAATFFTLTILNTHWLLSLGAGVIGYYSGLKIEEA